MGEGDASAGGDPQRLKRIAAAAYDYENDARWAGYWSNVLVPPHLASRSDVVDHFKRKFYQRYIVSPPFPLNPPRPVVPRLDEPLCQFGLDDPLAAVNSICLTIACTGKNYEFHQRVGALLLKKCLDNGKEVPLLGSTSRLSWQRNKSTGN